MIWNIFLFLGNTIQSQHLVWKQSENEVFPSDSLTEDPPICKYDLERDSFPGGHFPKDFRWSLATAAYQIEGAVNEDGKGQNIWDTWVHQRYSEDSNKCNIENCDTADIACDSYHHLDRDIENILSMRIQNYRFSISWSRLLPTGSRSGGINWAAVTYYNYLIDQLVLSDITLTVTLFHYDLPQDLQNAYEGWLGDKIVEDFGDYARICFILFGDRVKYWITINEPQNIADRGYGNGQLAPGVSCGDCKWTARHNTIRAHTEAYRIYDKEFRIFQNGFVGITLNVNWNQPITSTDSESANIKNAFDFEYWSDTIFLDGDYPETVKDILFDLNIQLPRFTVEEIKANSGAADFLGVNHYMSSLVGTCEINNNDCPFGFWETVCSNWPTSGSFWLTSNPFGMRRLMNYFDRKYNSTKYPIIITENGISSRGNGTDQEPELDDYWRIEFFHGYIGQLHRAIVEDGVNVIGYTAWSMMDNFEWDHGYSERFGLMWTNFSDPLRSIYKKKSAHWYKNVVTTNTIEPSN